MAWLRKKVLFSARRVWAAVSARLRARKAGSGGILKLHEDVQTCGYKDVQIMFDMLTSELEASHARKQQQQQQLTPSPRKRAMAPPPPAWPWPGTSSIVAAQ